MSFIELAKDRYSCRKLSDKTVETEKIDIILKSVSLAPTAVNNQPFKVWIIRSEEGVKKMEQVTSCTFGAKLFFVVGTKKENAWVRPFDNKNFGEIDASIAATHLMLQVHDIGLGTTWVGYFEDDKLKSNFPQTEGYDVVGIFPVGYPADDSIPSPKHVQTKPDNTLFEFV